MAGKNDEPDKPGQSPAPYPTEPTRPTMVRHDPTGGPTTGGMAEQQAWALKQVQANHAQRQAAAGQHQEVKGAAAREQAAEPARQSGEQPAQQQAAPKQLQTFEQRQAHAPDRASLKREQGSADRNAPASPPRQPGPPGGQGGSRPPNHYKELKTFEQRHPPQPGQARER